jgi:hypothetical protein
MVEVAMKPSDRTIRPSADALRRLPTLDVMTPDDWPESLRERARQADVDFRLELKLETRDRKYWLCTRGADKLRPGVLREWVVGYVIMESKDPRRKGEMMPYGPEATDELQDIDYVNLLREQIDLLAEQFAEEPSEECREKLDAAKREYDAMYNKWRKRE